MPVPEQASLCPRCPSLSPQEELVETQSKLGRSAQEVERLKGELRTANASGEGGGGRAARASHTQQGLRGVWP